MRRIEFVMLLFIGAMVVVINLGIMNYTKSKVSDEMTSEMVPSTEEDKQGLIAVASDVIDALMPQPDSLNVLLIGFDKSKALADINIVAHLDTESNQVKLISLPRDLYIDFREDKFKEIKINNPKLLVEYCKLTEVYSNAGHNDQALQDMKTIAGLITGLEIDHVAAVDTNGFVELVDIVGGVDFDVPQDMDYEDPAQDLYIHLKAGMQHLDGDKAEQLVRFRKYGGEIPPDKQRMKVQQDFLKVLTSRVLAMDDFSQLKALIVKGYDMLKTDIGLMTILEYAEYTLSQDIKALLSNGDMIIIPSSGERMGDLNLWYEKWDPIEAQLVVKQLLGDG